MPGAKIKPVQRLKTLRGIREPTNPLFLSNENNELQAAKSGSSTPFNILGGYRWPDAVSVECDLLRKIIRAEIGAL
jgi:hypothetical protein